MFFCWTGDDFSNTASLVDALLTLQEERDQRSLAYVPQPQTTSLPGAARAENVAGETAAEQHVSVIDSDRHVDASASASADVIGK